MRSRSEARMGLAACAVIGFALAYVLCQYAGWPRLLYQPISRSWRVGVPVPGEVVLSYPGLVVWGIGGAIVAGLVSWPISGHLRSTAVGLLGAWALTAAAVGIFFALWSLWPF